MEKYEFPTIENGLTLQCRFFVKKEFLPHDQCDELVKYYKDSTEDKKAKNMGFFADRVIWYTRIPDAAPVKEMMRQARVQTIKLIKEFYDVKHEIYGDSIQLVNWPEGLGMQPHYDNRHPNKNEIHTTPWREYAGVIYLNDDYSGGEWFISSVNPHIVIKPKKGMLVVFGCGDGFMHGVLPAYGNIRYTMPCWFTSDVTKKESECFASY